MPSIFRKIYEDTILVEHIFLGAFLKQYTFIFSAAAVGSYA